jgi:hypothetical protein
MNWYDAAGIALIGLTIAFPIWAASKIENDLENAPAVLLASEHLDG